MRRAILDLVQLSDSRFVEEISKGIGHIVEYVDSLDSVALRLIDMGEHRGASTVRALAEEEGAKVFILIDAVRCPPSEAKDRSRTLKGYYDHLAKYIYSEACWWRSADFAEVERAVERERLPYYLDGPNDVDWIVSNPAKANRERSMYVDYVQDVTSPKGEYYWVSPHTNHEAGRYEPSSPTSLLAARALHRVGLTTPAGLSIVAEVWRSFRPDPSTKYPELSRKIRETLEHTNHEAGRYEPSSPTSLLAARALHRVGLTTPAGLSIVAEVWRSFRPDPSTKYPELSRKIRETLELVIEKGLCSEGDRADLVKTVVDYWPFPLWSLDLRPADEPTLENLRHDRKAYIRRLIEIEEQRDPPPQIQRSKLEALSKAYDEWMLEYDQLLQSHPGNQGGGIIRIVPAGASPVELESYVRLRCLMLELTLEERMDLAALAWFGRNCRAGWEDLHSHARKTICDDDVDYECGLGSYWLKGFERWEAPPELPASLTDSGEKT